MKKNHTETPSPKSSEVASQIHSLLQEIAEEQEKIGGLEITLAAVLTPSDPTEEEPSYEAIIERQANLTHGIVKAKMRAEYLTKRVEDQEREYAFIRQTIEIPQEKERLLKPLLETVRRIKETLELLEQLFMGRKTATEKLYEVHDEQRFYEKRFNIVSPPVELESGFNKKDGPFYLDYQGIEFSVRQLLLISDPLTVDKKGWQAKLRNYEENKREENRRITKTHTKVVQNPPPFPSTASPALGLPLTGSSKVA